MMVATKLLHRLKIDIQEEQRWGTVVHLREKCPRCQAGGQFCATLPLLPYCSLLTLLTVKAQKSSEGWRGSVLHPRPTKGLLKVSEGQTPTSSFMEETGMIFVDPWKAF